MFLKLASAAAVNPALGVGQSGDMVDLRRCRIVFGAPAGDRANKAAQVLVEEAEKRCGLLWPIESGHGEDPAAPPVVIYLATRAATGGLEREILAGAPELATLREDGFLIRTGRNASGQWIAVIGADDRGLLFGVGSLLRRIEFGRQSALAPVDRDPGVRRHEVKGLALGDDADFGLVANGVLNLEGGDGPAQSGAQDNNAWLGHSRSPPMACNVRRHDPPVSAGRL